MRTCVGCRSKRPQNELLRVALAADGRMVVSRTAAGRGAWLCRPASDCLALAVRRRAFDRALRMSAAPDSIRRLQDDIAAGTESQAS